MRKVTGFAFIVAGLGIGAFAIAPSHNFGEQPEAAQSPTSNPGASGEMLRPEVLSPAAQASKFSSAVVITVVPHIGKSRIAQERFAIPKDRDALTRELQKELRRVGCYEGDISGTWSESTRRAMKTFIERVNARLPTEEPDSILYALVKGQEEPICGIACSHAEGESADKHCVPNLLLHAQSKAAPSATQAVEKPAVAVDGSVGTAPQSTEPSLEGRMGLAGPSAGPTVRTTTHTPRDRATPAATAIFSPRVSNN
jgi:hypothetical protein